MRAEERFTIVDSEKCRGEITQPLPNFTKGTSGPSKSKRGEKLSSRENPREQAGASSSSSTSSPLLSAAMIICMKHEGKKGREEREEVRGREECG